MNINIHSLRQSMKDSIRRNDEREHAKKQRDSAFYFPQQRLEYERFALLQAESCEQSPTDAENPPREIAVTQRKKKPFVIK